MFYIDFIYYRLAGFTLIEILSHWTGTVSHDCCSDALAFKYSTPDLQSRAKMKFKPGNQ